MTVKMPEVSRICSCNTCRASSVLMWETDFPANNELIFTGEAEVNKLLEGSECRLREGSGEFRGKKPGRGGGPLTD